MSKDRLDDERDSGVSKNVGSVVSARTMIANYLQEVEALAAEKRIRRLSSTAVLFSMSETQQERYALAIHQILEAHNVDVLSPDVLFRAADLAVLGQASETQARIGLQPGTMNPVHYGHLSASLAAMLAESLDLVLLMNGANVPDKPDTANADLRHEMLQLAVAENGFPDWLWTTPIRQQIAEMFLLDPRLLLFLGRNDLAKRSKMDMAAFIWLFRANPKVRWTYVVGSDKISGYGRKGECDLIVNTLGDVRANANVLYIDRHCEAIDVEKDIAAYDWMLERWKTGFFKQSPLPTYQTSASAIRAAIATCNTDTTATVAGEALPGAVLKFILGNDELLSSYAREAALKKFQE